MESTKYFSQSLGRCDVMSIHSPLKDLKWGTVSSGPPNFSRKIILTFLGMKMRSHCWETFDPPTL